MRSWKTDQEAAARKKKTDEPMRKVLSWAKKQKKKKKRKKKENRKGEQERKAVAFREMFEGFQNQWQTARSQLELLPADGVTRWIPEAASRVEAARPHQRSFFQTHTRNDTLQSTTRGVAKATFTQHVPNQRTLDELENAGKRTSEDDLGEPNLPYKFRDLGESGASPGTV